MPVDPARGLELTTAETIGRCAANLRRVDPELSWSAALDRVIVMLRYKLAR